MDIPFEHRLAYIEQQYGHYPTDWLIDAVNRIQKKLGGKEAQTAVQYLKDNNIIAAFAILLRYYDKLYKKGFEDRLSLGGKVQHIPCPSVNNNENVSLLIEAEENKIINKAISAFTNIFTNKNT